MNMLKKILKIAGLLILVGIVLVGFGIYSGVKKVGQPVKYEGFQVPGVSNGLPWNFGVFNGFSTKNPNFEQLVCADSYPRKDMLPYSEKWLPLANGTTFEEAMDRSDF